MHCGNISFGLNLSTFLLVCAIGFDWRIKQVPILRWWCNCILRTVSYRWHCLSLLVVFLSLRYSGDVRSTHIHLCHLSHLTFISLSSQSHITVISLSSQSHLTVISVISELSRCHLSHPTVISLSSRSHLKATSATFY